MTTEGTLSFSKCFFPSMTFYKIELQSDKERNPWGSLIDVLSLSRGPWSPR